MALPGLDCLARATGTKTAPSGVILKPDRLSLSPGLPTSMVGSGLVA